MLDGFGLYPVCLHVDLDSYEIDWRHVARFRNRSGWLMVAQAEIWAGDQQANMPMIVGCDEWGEPIPSFIAANLLACACSLPQPCDDMPPAILDFLLQREREEVRKRWLRESNATIARIHEEGTLAIERAEHEVSVKIRVSEREIADLRRRRRQLPPDHPARSVFAEVIAEQEDWQNGMMEWLADRRQELRDHYEREERRASRGQRPIMEVTSLYVINWHDRALPNVEMVDLWRDAVGSTRYWGPGYRHRDDLPAAELTLEEIARIAALAPRLKESAAATLPKDRPKSGI